MIFVDRGKVSPPPLLRSDIVWKRIFEDAFYYSESLERRRQERREFDRKIVRHSTVERALLRLFQRKCAYCECILSEEFVVDHFRPPRAALHAAKVYSEDHYWWLAYDWNNLNLACRSCHDAKGSKFPIEGAPAEIFATADDLAKERRYLVNPCIDFPENHFFYSEFGEIGGLTSAGKATVSALDLNRADLLAARRKHRRMFAPSISAFGSFARTLKLDPDATREGSEGLISAAVARWKRDRSSNNHVDKVVIALEPHSPFLGMTRDFVMQVLRRNRGIMRRRRIPGARKDGPDSLASSTLRREIATKRIESVDLWNFRTISRLHLEFPSTTGDRAPWLMLLGENAAGKTSILQAIALTLMGDKRRSALKWLSGASILRQGATVGHVKVRLSGIRPIKSVAGEGTSPDMEVTLSFSRRGITCSHPQPPVFLLGYGSMRLVKYRSEEGKPEFGNVRVSNLFDHFTPLINADRWLWRQPRDRFDYTARAIKDVLQLRSRERLERRKSTKKTTLQLRLFRSRVKLEALSDGYQSVLALTADIIRAASVDGGLEAAEGIVLLDEIGAHLHPRWRMLVVSSLRRAFPRMQFVASTHDPLCLRGLENGEVAVLRRNRHHRVFSVGPLPPISGMTSEQLLTSEYFGLFSTIDPETERDFCHYYRLLSERRPSADDNRELQELRTKLERLKVLGQTQRERILLRIIDEFLALEPQDPKSVAEQSLDRIVRHQLAALLTPERENSTK